MRRVRLRRSGAEVSTTSSTACTRVPNTAPPGRWFIGERCPPRRVRFEARERRFFRLVVLLGCSTSLPTPGSSCAAAVSAEYEVRRQFGRSVGRTSPRRGGRILPGRRPGELRNRELSYGFDGDQSARRGGPPVELLRHRFVVWAVAPPRRTPVTRVRGRTATGAAVERDVGIRCPGERELAFRPGDCDIQQSQFFTGLFLVVRRLCSA